jgi:hypothetical protein
VEILRLQSGKTLIPVSHPHSHSVCLATLDDELYIFADNYMMLCTIEADLSRVPLLPRPTGQGNFYRVDYDIVLLFRMTELNAQIAWKEKVSVAFICCSIQQISD